MNAHIEIGQDESGSCDCWIRTDRAGQITQLDPRCPTLLNLTARGALGRELIVFFPGDHAAIMEQLRAASVEHGVRRTLSVTFRPKERAPRRMSLDLRKLDDQTIEWRMDYA